MSTSYKGFDLNDANTEPPWGDRELAFHEAIIDYVSGDVVNNTADTSGHKHANLYSLIGGSGGGSIAPQARVSCDVSNVTVASDSSNLGKVYIQSDYQTRIGPITSWGSGYAGANYNQVLIRGGAGIELDTNAVSSTVYVATSNFTATCHDEVHLSSGLYSDSGLGYDTHNNSVYLGSGSSTGMTISSNKSSITFKSGFSIGSMGPTYNTSLVVGTSTIDLTGKAKFHGTTPDFGLSYQNPGTAVGTDYAIINALVGIFKDMGIIVR